MLRKTLLAILLVTLLLVSPMPLDAFKMRWPALTGELENAAHIVLFAGLAWAVYRSLEQYLPRLGPYTYLVAFVVVVGFGLVMEIVQAKVGRDSAWIDLANDAAGALGALLLIAWKRRRREHAACRGANPLLAVAALVVVATALSPLCWTIAAYTYRAMASPVIWRPDSLLMARFSKWYPWRHPVFELTEVPLNGHRPQIVEVDIRNLTDEELHLRLVVRGARHPFRSALLARRNIILAPAERRTLGFSRAELLATTHLGDIDLTIAGQLVIAQDKEARMRQFQVEEVRDGESGSEAGLTARN